MNGASRARGSRLGCAGDDSPRDEGQKQQRVDAADSWRKLHCKQIATEGVNELLDACQLGMGTGSLYSSDDM